jgi:ABC-type lipoprotein export system ATPase subunit
MNEAKKEVPAIQAAGLRKTYRGDGMETEVLKGIDLSVLRGEFVGIMGESGSGKSTLLHLLGTLDNPTAGELFLSGQRADTLPDAEKARLRCRDIGFIFQSYYLVPGLSVLENVMVPSLLLHRLDEAYLLSLLEKVGLSHRMRHKPSQLSGGEQQRVAIARALANHPSVLLADEPTGSLDSRNSAQILELIRSIHRESGVTLVMVTHSAENARHCDRILHMKDGELA